MAFHESLYFKEKVKERYKIEAKNGKLKNAHGFGRPIAYGINNMEMQAAIALFTVNVKKTLKLVLI